MISKRRSRDIAVLISEEFSTKNCLGIFIADSNQRLSPSILSPIKCCTIQTITQSPSMQYSAENVSSLTPSPPQQSPPAAHHTAPPPPPNATNTPHSPHTAHSYSRRPRNAPSP
jgi:hypothetical protein